MHFGHSTLTNRWQEELGIQVQIDSKPRYETLIGEYSMLLDGWSADFPDPDNFLGQSSFNYYLRKIGWEDPEYDRLIETAAGLQDRKQRLALYRQADRRVVVELAVILPIFYPTGAGLTLAKPWVKNLKTNLLNWEYYQDIVIEQPTG